MKFRLSFIVILWVIVPLFATAQHFPYFLKYWFVRNNDTLPYRLLLPANYTPMRQYPLVLLLHGSGGRGNNNNSQLNTFNNVFHNDKLMLKYPAFILVPQCAKNSAWSNYWSKKDSITKIRTYSFPQHSNPRRSLELTIELISELEQNYPIDTTRLYVGGISMGAFGTYEIVDRLPGKFAAAFVICGVGDTSNAKTLSKTSWWIFHGEKDSTVFPINARNMASALERVGADVKLTIYPEDSHNSWDDAFKEPELFAWMFEQKLKAQ